MKTTKFIVFILVLFFAISFSFAQDDVYSTTENKQSKEKKEKEDIEKPSKRKINTGYVFIDGKYVEPPYKFKTKNHILYLNNFEIKNYRHEIQSRDKVVVSPKFPYYPDGLSQNDSIDAFLLAIDPKSGVNFWTLSLHYFLSKYSYEDAVIKMIEYVNNAPNIKKYYNGTLIAENGEEMQIILISKMYLPTIASQKNFEKGIKNTLKMWQSSLQESLKDNEIIFFISDSKLNKIYLSQKDLKRLVIQLYEFKIKVFSYQEKLEILSKEFRITDQIILEQIIDNADIPEDIYNNFKNDLSYYQNKSSAFHDSISCNNSIKSCEAHCPKEKKINIICSATYDIALNYEIEMDEIINLVDEYGYDNYSIFSDDVPNDNLSSNITFEQFKNGADAGIVLFVSHGSEDYGIQIVCFKDLYELMYWTNFHPLINYYRLYNNNFSSNECWGAFASAEWFSIYWKDIVTVNNGIVILSSCESFLNGCTSACIETDNYQSGVALGYNNSISSINSAINHRRLFRLLTGKSGVSNYRTVEDAYYEMDIVNATDFRIVPEYGANITLCPATKEYYPENNAIVSSAVSSGFFETDTWCDATQPAWQALKLEFSNGDLSYNPATDVYWDNPVDGRSNKIIYKWSGTEGNVKVKVFPQYIIAYGGGGQQLDFDRVSPNGEEGNYSFSVVDTEIEGFTCNFSASPSTSVCSGNTVRFNPYCTSEVTNYSWSFEGGYPELSTESNPEIYYGESGLYDVTLYAWNSENEVFSITKNDYIYVYDSDIAYDNTTVSCDYFLYGDAEIKYIVYVDYVPEGYSYDITVYYGDGTTSSTQTVENPTILESIRHYSYYGTYYPFVEVKLTGQDEVLFFTDCGNVDVVNLNPCSNFTADFNFYSEDPYTEDPQPNEEIFFEHIINNCGENCYWSWDFASEPSSPVYNDDPIWCSLNTNVDVTHTYNIEGNYYVKLTVYESENGCLPFVVEKEVPVGHHVTCLDPINIYCSHYKPGNPIDRVLVRKYFCALELYWQHTINTFDQCQPIDYPDCAVMYLYRFGTLLSTTHTNLIRTSPYSSVAFPWYFPHDYCYYTALTWDYLPYGRYIFQVNVFPKFNDLNDYATGEIDVDIVDCDLTATFNGNINEDVPTFSGAVNNPPYYSSGKFILNSSVNEFVNSNSGIYTACNGIILCDGFKTGDKSFIATGDGFADCITYPINWWGYYYSALPDIIEESQNSIILTFEASPNPYRDFIDVYIELSKSSEAILSLFGYNGTFIEMLAKADLTAGLNEFEFDLGTLSPGTYMLKALINDSEEKTLKITKQ